MNIFVGQCIYKTKVKSTIEKLLKINKYFTLHTSSILFQYYVAGFKMPWLMSLYVYGIVFFYTTRRIPKDIHRLLF